MKNFYLPQSARIIEIKELSSNVKLFRLKPSKSLPKNKNLAFIPGQFVLVGIWGWGEAPFGICSSPYENRYFEVAIRKVGNLTAKLHQLEKGDIVSWRGPYGNGYPLEFFEGKDLVMVTGGCGIPPIAALIEYVLKNREKFLNVYLLYGAATPKDLLFKEKYAVWGKGIKIILTVDKPDEDWVGHVGLVSNLISEIKVNPQNTAVAMCGPGPMAKAIENILRPLGISDRRIYISEERKMQCGLGKCQHCVTGEKYVCLDGPVFNFDELDKNWD